MNDIQPSVRGVAVTKKQVELLVLIRDWTAKHGCSPTMQEMSDVLGVSKVTVFERVHGLIRKGALLHTPHKPQSLRLAPGVLLHDEAKAVPVDVLRRITDKVPGTQGVRDSLHALISEHAVAVVRREA